MTHYEALGIERTASPEEVKAAYRRSASAAHPDRDGGSVERMAAVNRAYEVLGDAERRQRYDETGADHAPTSIEVAARSMLLQLFSDLMDEHDGNLVEIGGQFLAAHRDKLTAEIEKLKTQRARIVKRAGRVKAKGDENLVQMLADQKVAQIDEAVNQSAMAHATTELAIKMLATYESEAVPPPAPRPMFTTGYVGASATGGWGGWP